MARLAVLWVGLAILAVVALGQTPPACDTQTLAGTVVVPTSGDVIIDAIKIYKPITGKITVNYAQPSGSTGFTVDYQKNQGYLATKVLGIINITRPEPDSANRISSVNMLAALALGAVALVSQRGSMAVLAIVLAVATVAFAACGTSETVELDVTILNDVKTITYKIKADSVTGLCPTGVSVLGDVPHTSSAAAGVCTIVYTNPLFGCQGCSKYAAGVANASCSAGICSYNCTGTLMYCGGSAANGCTMSIGGDVNNCGACNRKCSVVTAHATGFTCVASGPNIGKCDYDACALGWSDCDGNRDNGCETNSDTDAGNCGGCLGVDAAAADCSQLDGVAAGCDVQCVGGQCAVADCCDTANGKANCDSNGNNGCETTLGTDSDCSGCGDDCNTQLNNVASGVCVANQCVYVCTDPTKFGDCTSEQGCETSLEADPLNCGECGLSCATLNNTIGAEAQCIDSACKIKCDADHFDCDGDYTNGCEVSYKDDVNNCGGCGNATNPNDPRDCTKLPGLLNEVCNNGVCEGTCDVGNGFDNCDPNRVGQGCPDKVDSVDFCGGCENNCSAILNNVNGAACSGSPLACTYASCADLFGNCNNNPADGCEKSVASDVANCGSCSFDCAQNISHATATCVDGVCHGSNCIGAFLNCDTSDLNGCEKSKTDADTCGSCDVNCNNLVLNATGVFCTETFTCDFGQCSDVSNFDNCDTVRANGCETPLKTSPLNCGACGTDCTKRNNTASGVTCTNKVCDTNKFCKPNFYDCDGNRLNGCETPAGSSCQTATFNSGGACTVAMKIAGKPNGFNCADLVTDPDANVASASCSLTTGTCVFTCDNTHSDCDLDPTNGCETPVANCNDVLTQGQGCNTALNDPSGVDVNCLVLVNDPKVNVTVVVDATSQICSNDNGQCQYTCAPNWYDCNKFASDGCEIDQRLCKEVVSDATCIFNLDTQCGPQCIDCTVLSGTLPGGVDCIQVGGLDQCDLTAAACNDTLCVDADGDWSTGCEQAQGYLGLGVVDCSKDIDLTNVEYYGPILCVGDSDLPNAGRCDFVCKENFFDCDDSPFNGCETNLLGDCGTGCVYQADTRCGKDKCVDCTQLEGTLLTFYQNPSYASASASTCLQLPDEFGNVLDDRVAEFICDTSVHYLNPRFDPPNGKNGACQSELCRDLDNDWTNGCESAQQYGRGRFYYYGDQYNTDAYLVPYVPNPYEARFYEFKKDFLNQDEFPQNTVIEQIKSLWFMYDEDFQYPFDDYNLGSIDNLAYYLYWEDLVGFATEDGYYIANDDYYWDPQTGYVSSDDGTELLTIAPRDFILLHYTVDEFTMIDEPEEAAAMAIIGEPYETPVDCVLTEWSDWGKCTYDDACVNQNFWTQTSIRTRSIITQASGGGVCHLPIVEDFYRFAHRASAWNDEWYDTDTGLWVVDSYGNDHQHGGGLGAIVDYTDKMFNIGNSLNLSQILYWGPQDWTISYTTEDYMTGGTDGRQLLWSGIETPGEADLEDVGVVSIYGRVLACNNFRNCNESVPRTNCTLSQWSEWTDCTAECDGDWAGGVRIRTRTVEGSAYSNGLCFIDEFDVDGNPLVPNAGMLYEEDWQCNDHSCSSFDCTDLIDAPANMHIDNGPVAIEPVCDGEDWPEYVDGYAFIDYNRDGWDDNTFWEFWNGKVQAMDGNFQLFDTIYSFGYDYRWPGHCLYDCMEGYYDCNKDPRDGCETDGDFCSIDDLYNGYTQLTHPILPWLHPHGDCSIAWDNTTISTDCNDHEDTIRALDYTVGLCDYNTESDNYGNCEPDCIPGYFNCRGDGCIIVDGSSDYGFCGYDCVNCDQLNRFGYGVADYDGSRWECYEYDDYEYSCIPTDDCMDGCVDADEDPNNGCETARYVQWPYPDVEPFDVQYDDWSDWTECSQADDCGFLWDMSDEGGIFRNVPLQTRYRHPTYSAYNGGFYDDFKYTTIVDSDEEPTLEGFPDLWDFEADDEWNAVGRLGAIITNVTKILGITLVQTPFYEVRVCEGPIAPCMECTNQLEGLEVDCDLSEWGPWSACTAECVDRIHDYDYLEGNNYYAEDDELDVFDTLSANGEYVPTDITLGMDGYRYYWIVDRQPYQIRTRFVESPSSNGGRCPPPGDTWQLKEASYHVEYQYDYDVDGLTLEDFYVDNYIGDFYYNANNEDLSAQVSFLVDVRKCNSQICEYPEDCHALNYWYPGHFKSIATCVDTATYFEGTWPNSAYSDNDDDVVSFCWTSDYYTEMDYACNEMNGYCNAGYDDRYYNDYNYDLRNGCDTYIYNDHCGIMEGDHEYCEYEYFADCTTLPGVTSRFSAPCMNLYDPFTGPDYDVHDIEDGADNAHDHFCDIRWACDDDLCTNEEDHYNTDLEWSWLDGCETAHNYRYPFVTVVPGTVEEARFYVGWNIWDDEVYYGNPMDLMTLYLENYVDTGDDNYLEDIDYFMFYDPRDNYTLSAVAPADNSVTFAFDCQYYLYYHYEQYSDLWFDHDNDADEFTYDILMAYCAWDGINEAEKWEDDYYTGYVQNYGCHLAGGYESDEWWPLGFGCNGVWGAYTSGWCTMNCAWGFVDADLDPRNGCETDTEWDATPEDKYIWVGNCKTIQNGTVTVNADATCGADLCVDCLNLPGINQTGSQKAKCELAEEVAGKIPILKYDDGYYAIQWVCSIRDKGSYVGMIDFDDQNLCNEKCADGDHDWTNGCEQGRGYANPDTYQWGKYYDDMFDEVDLGAEADGSAPCNPDFTEIDGCDKRSSGFENPIPGAWFWQNIPSIDPLIGKVTRPAYELWYYLDDVDGEIAAINDETGCVDEECIDDDEAVDNRAFDCSLLYSTVPLYDEDMLYVGPGCDQIKDTDVVGVLAGYYCDDVDAVPIYTFAEVHNIDIEWAKSGVNTNKVCNNVNGLCTVTCIEDWADFDEDPSNGCEADLTGPCGLSSQKTYDSVYSCGPNCVDCTRLAGTYNGPEYTKAKQFYDEAKSVCRTILPGEYIWDDPTDKPSYDADIKFYWRFENIRFGQACVTESVYPLTTPKVDQNAYQNLVCDPRRCLDDDFDPDNGCETATGYPEEWSTDEWAKASYNHWFSKVVEPTTGERYPATTYWIRKDGTIALGRRQADCPTCASFAPTGAPDVWEELLDIWENVWHTYDGDVDANYWFELFSVDDIVGLDYYEWYDNTSSPRNAANGWAIFPYIDVDIYDDDEPDGWTSGFDCTNAMVPTGVHMFEDETEVYYEFNTELPGPWFHVDQSKGFDQFGTQCYAGVNPGLPNQTYTDAGLFRKNFCSTTTIGNTNAAANWECYDDWFEAAAGHCSLKCETDWADGDGDPTNGCESYLNDRLPFPRSQCGSAYVNPYNLTNLNRNYNRDTSCGAGYCLACSSLGGVVSSNVPFKLDQMDPRGLKSKCYDGGDDWIDTDWWLWEDFENGPNDYNGMLVDSLGVTVLDDAINYPGDYYCANIINNYACLKSQLSMPCIQGTDVNCTSNQTWFKSPQGDGVVQPSAIWKDTNDDIWVAEYLQVCEDRDSQWQTGCEVALGYNLNSQFDSESLFDGTPVRLTGRPNLYIDVVSTSTQDFVIQGDYKRSVGVKPKWTNHFEEIDWIGGDGDTTPLAPLPGFDCEILRKLPRYHTHVVPQFEQPTAAKIECQANGKCSFLCDTNWRDCDGNPWNGCEQPTKLCSDGPSGCDLPEFDKTMKSDCNSLNAGQNSVTLDRTSFCDGNQIPYDDWRADFYDNQLSGIYWNLYEFDVDEYVQLDDAGTYDYERFDITDHGLNWVDVLYNDVDPEVSRYTIKGYWDDVDIDYVCRIFLTSWNLVENDYLTAGIRNYALAADANRATGTCVMDCRDDGYSDCKHDVSNGCESHLQDSSCRYSDGSCKSCSILYGLSNPTLAKCIYFKLVGGVKVDIGTLSVSWTVGDLGITAPYTVTYGEEYGISSVYPMCDIRGLHGLGTLGACDDTYCRDYDGDWENGCEFPMNEDVYDRSEWEVAPVTYAGTDVDEEGFDCSWIYDPQPDAGGRNYGGKTWAQYYHVDLTPDVANAYVGECIGKIKIAATDVLGTCRIKCVANYSDCDGDPTNGCENDERLCTNCTTAQKYPGGAVYCPALTNKTRGFVPFSKEPICNGRDGEDGLCSYYFCNIFNGYCDSGRGDILESVGCVKMSDNDANGYCGADWNWRDMRSNKTTVSLADDPEDNPNANGAEDNYDLSYEGGQILDYSVFDGTGRCATCSDLGGYVSENAYCQFDPAVAGHSYNDKMMYYKPAASGWIDNSLGYIEFVTAGNTAGDYLCELHADDSSDIENSGGACDQNLCVDEDYYWANGCETAVNYEIDLLVDGWAGPQRGHGGNWGDFGFDYHFAFNDYNFGKFWPYNAEINGEQVSGVERSEIRGIWCPFLQFWSLATDNYYTAGCNVFPCPHFAMDTLDHWITCVNNATADNAGKCNYICNEDAGWKDCDGHPMNGCETDVYNDGTCGWDCEQVECNALTGINPFYWSECLVPEGKCDIAHCNDDDTHLCKDRDGDWTNGCETAINYPNGEEYDCDTVASNETLHLDVVQPCNGEPGNHWFGMCEFTCDYGWVDCDGEFWNGCEHDGTLCQDCTKALGYVTYFDGADFWEYWGEVNAADDEDGDGVFLGAVYGSYFVKKTYDAGDYTLHYDGFMDSRVDSPVLHDQFDGPEVFFAQYHRAYVAAFDCATLDANYPGHFVNGDEIYCDADKSSATAGLCVYECDGDNGYFDCDGDPRNGCEHQSGHRTCGNFGACRDCYFISGVDYPVDSYTNMDDYTTFDGINDGSLGPYTDSGLGFEYIDWTVSPYLDGEATMDVYSHKIVRYYSLPESRNLYEDTDRVNSPLRVGCVNEGDDYRCNLDTCQSGLSGYAYCRNTNQNSEAATWRDGCEMAQKYPFGTAHAAQAWDCSQMGPDAADDVPKDSSEFGKPYTHVRQVVGTFGCDSKYVNMTGHPFDGFGAWRFVLKRYATRQVADWDDINLVNFTEGTYAYDFEGIENYFTDITDDYGWYFWMDDAEGETVEDFPLYRVRGGERPGTCYYECEFGYEDCDGDPRNGCEVDLSACIDVDGDAGWDTLTAFGDLSVANGCETALGYWEEFGTGYENVNCHEIWLTADDNYIDDTKPIYCRGGQDNKEADGRCQFTCMAGHQDCDGDPFNGCEEIISDTKCNCRNCIDYLPGTMSQDDTDINADGYSKSKSTCLRDPSGDPNLDECSVPCNTDLCDNVDNDWTNGCELAVNYPPLYGGEDVGSWNCAVWSHDLLLAKKHHMSTNPKRLATISCEGRSAAIDAGTCNFQGACLTILDGALHNYQDCDSDPRNGCEDIGRYCKYGQSEEDPYATANERCSSALRYVCNSGVNVLGLPCEDPTTEVPYPFSEDATTTTDFDCWILTDEAYAADHNIDLTTVTPYCDRDPSSDSRGDCIFECLDGWANCDNIASTGCEADISLDETCSEECINCDQLSGMDRNLPYGCETDGAGGYQCYYECGQNLDPTLNNCADKDGYWETGCEVAMNGDDDVDGVFMNPGQPMDCSAMQREAIKNPELFRHHLHIDLTVYIDGTDGSVIPPGSIFCNSGLGSSNGLGTCFFACIPGFINGDLLGYNGCESEDPDVDYPPAEYVANYYVTSSPGVNWYGGFWVGDYHQELFVDFLCDIEDGLISPYVEPEGACAALTRENWASWDDDDDEYVFWY